jgi:hypothetical protein
MESSRAHAPVRAVATAALSKKLRLERLIATPFFYKVSNSSNYIVLNQL